MRGKMRAYIPNRFNKQSGRILIRPDDVVCRWRALETEPSQGCVYDVRIESIHEPECTNASE